MHAEVVAALIWRENRFLACQRPAHKARGLLWEFVGGKVEIGETKQQALIRECQEELAVDISVKNIFMELDHVYPDLSVHLTLFHAEIVSGTPMMLEHNDIRWITTEEIDQYTFCPADVPILEQLKKINTTLQVQLFSTCDHMYRDFQCSLMPTVPKERVIGVRVPELWKLLRRMPDIVDVEAFLRDLPHRYYEEDLLHGMLISACKDLDTALEYLESFLPHVDNWAVCDSISPVAFRNNPHILPGRISSWLLSEHSYTIRFGIAILLKYYLGSAFSPEYLQWVASVKADDYYVRMMVAWFFATALAKQYTHAVSYLEGKLLPPWIHNKTITKAVESYRIRPETKQYLKTLRIKGGNRK